MKIPTSFICFKSKLCPGLCESDRRHQHLTTSCVNWPPKSQRVPYTSPWYAQDGVTTPDQKPRLYIHTEIVWPMYSHNDGPSQGPCTENGGQANLFHWNSSCLTVMLILGLLIHTYSAWIPELYTTQVNKVMGSVMSTNPYGHLSPV